MYVVGETVVRSLLLERIPEIHEAVQPLHVKRARPFRLQVDTSIICERKRRDGGQCAASASFAEEHAKSFRSVLVHGVGLAFEQ